MFGKGEVSNAKSVARAKLVNEVTNILKDQNTNNIPTEVAKVFVLNKDDFKDRIDTDSSVVVTITK